jgi:hypothetical protein
MKNEQAERIYKPKEEFFSLQKHQETYSQLTKENCEERKVKVEEENSRMGYLTLQEQWHDSSSSSE